MKELIRYEKYSRKDIHDVFSPDTNFTPQTGSWGLHGIIRVPGTQHDYIFLVTYGKKQSGHEFDENIDENGILTWQSQPSQTLNESRIIDFINHDYLKNNIYLFLWPHLQDMEVPGPGTESELQPLAYATAGGMPILNPFFFRLFFAIS